MSKASLKNLEWVTWLTTACGGADFDCVDHGFVVEGRALRVKPQRGLACTSGLVGVVGGGVPSGCCSSFVPGVSLFPLFLVCLFLSLLPLFDPGDDAYEKSSCHCFSLS